MNRKSTLLKDILLETGKPKRIKEGLGSWVKDKMEKFWKSLGGEPVKAEELQQGEKYRLEGYDESGKARAIANPSKAPMPQYLANVIYDGPTGSDKHIFVIDDVYKDYEPLSGAAPRPGRQVMLSAKEVEVFIKTAG